MDTGASFGQPKPSPELLHKFQEKQNWWQTRQAQKGFVHLTGKADRLTSIILPLGMAAVGGVMMVRALHHLYTGTGKGDQ